jgi:hypothetical protein
VLQKTEDGRRKTENRRQMTAEATSNEKLLRGVQGDGFLEKSPPGSLKKKAFKDIIEWDVQI